jgi:uncharacterized protein DUF6221
VSAVTEEIEFLRRCLAEDEWWAVAASTWREHHGGRVLETGVHWRWGAGDDWEPALLDPALDALVTSRDNEHTASVTLLTAETVPSVNLPGYDAPAYSVHCEEVPVAVGGHIVRHDPAAVLADVVAKRRVLLTVESWYEKNPHGGPHDCAIGILIALLLSDLAAMYAGRPGYRPEWAQQEAS